MSGRDCRALRAAWILDRGDTVEYEGRDVRPEDNGYLSVKHADAKLRGESGWSHFPG